MSQIISFAPGKIMLAGEWAVLELENPCIVMGIKKGITVTVTPSDSFSTHQSLFVRHAIDVVSRYLCEQNFSYNPCKISIKSEISGDKTNGYKPGFGSSAAVVVAVIKALLQFHGHVHGHIHGQDIGSEQAKKIIFTLSCIAHYRAQGQLGSCFDVAASVYGGVLVYKRFDPVWFEKKLQTCRISDLTTQEWPYLEMTPLQLPANIQIKTVFSGTSANTCELMQAMGLFKKHNQKTYNNIIGTISCIVKQLILAIQQQDSEKILSLIRQNRILLQELSEKSGLALETQSLKKICDDAESYGCAAKFSGAGGGDCAIVVCKTA